MGYHIQHARTSLGDGPSGHQLGRGFHEEGIQRCFDTQNCRSSCYCFVALINAILGYADRDEQMGNKWQFSRPNDQQMSNKIRVEHQTAVATCVFFLFFLQIHLDDVDDHVCWMSLFLALNVRHWKNWYHLKHPETLQGWKMSFLFSLLKNKDPKGSMSFQFYQSIPPRSAYSRIPFPSGNSHKSYQVFFFEDDFPFLGPRVRWAMKKP